MTESGTTEFVEPAPGQAACIDCGTGLFWTERGKRPTKCPECSGKPRRSDPDRDLVPVPAEASRQTKTRASLTVREERAEVMANGWAAQRLSVGLGMTDDLRAAAALAGVTIDGRAPTEDELVQLAERARSEELKGLRDGMPSETAMMLNRFVMLNAISLLEQEPLIPIAQRASAARMAQQVIDAMAATRSSGPRCTFTSARRGKRSASDATTTKTAGPRAFWWLLREELAHVPASVGARVRQHSFA